jgi:hypothetical protein
VVRLDGEVEDLLEFLHKLLNRHFWIYFSKTKRACRVCHKIQYKNTDIYMSPNRYLIIHEWKDW